MTHMMEQMTLPGLEETTPFGSAQRVTVAGRTRWPMVKLGQISSSIDYGVTASANFDGIGNKFLRITDIQENCVEWDSVPWCKCSEKEAISSYLLPGDIVFARTGATTGKSFLIKNCPENAVFASYLIRVRLSKLVDPEFISFFFQSPNYWQQIANNARGAAQPGVNSTVLKSLEISLPPLPEQQRIVARLDKAQQLIDQRKEQLKLMDTLVQSLFYEMFGDPVKNEKGWGEVYLQEVADIASGVTKGRNLAGKETHEIPYMRVANVQDGHLNLSSIATIPVTIDEMNRYRLLKGDLLLTEGGDPDKLGRGAIWQAEIEPCIHQNHIFRVRLNAQKILPGFASALIASPRCKRYFLSAAKQTTGIASINMTQLKKSPMLLPPLPLQQAFADRVQQIEALKQSMTASLRELEHNFNALMQEAFGGK